MPHQQMLVSKALAADLTNVRFESPVTGINMHLKRIFQQIKQRNTLTKHFVHSLHLNCLRDFAVVDSTALSPPSCPVD